MSEEQQQNKEPEDQNQVEKDGSVSGSTAAKPNKQYFKEELKRLQNALNEEQEKVHAPPIQEHVPYTFNALGPYYNCETARFIIELGDEDEEKKNSEDTVSLTPSYLSRKTALGMCDPWVAHRMDVELEPKSEKPPTTPRNENKKEKDDKKKDERPAKEGSTRLPKFPVVGMSKKGIKQDLVYSDVPGLRQVLKDKIGAGAETKVSADYNRTKQDFFRMELDKMEEYHPINRQNMKGAYYAYLQNTPGSTKAIRECVKSKEKAS